MNNSEFGFETEAIRTIRALIFRTFGSIYNVKFIFEDAEDMRASFAEEKTRNIYSR
jgi:O-succinylhomoserine sulfhydrylase